jgi:hypothetical protein
MRVFTTLKGANPRRTSSCRAPRAAPSRSVSSGTARCCTPVLVAGTRGYAFTGDGTFGGLLAAGTWPTTFGGPNGIRTRVYSPPRATFFDPRTSAMLTKHRACRDSNSDGGSLLSHHGHFSDLCWGFSEGRYAYPQVRVLSQTTRPIGDDPVAPQPVHSTQPWVSLLITTRAIPRLAPTPALCPRRVLPQAP